VTSYSFLIILANEMSQDGILNLESQARADLAARLFTSGDFQKIITCGWDYRDDSDMTIANAIETYLVSKKNIKSEYIYSEKQSRDTVGDAVFTRRLFAENKLTELKLTVVTSNYHCDRTEKIFNFVYGSSAHVKVIGAEVPAINAQLLNEKLSLTAFKKTFDGITAGDIVSIFDRMIEFHPFYNGEQNPQFRLNRESISGQFLDMKSKADSK
jgi:uncharacterized SAM-binding protein YcdF (DUF218 family)